MKYIVYLLVLSSCFSCSAQSNVVIDSTKSEQEIKVSQLNVQTYSKAAIVTGKKEATKIGLEIMQMGGNAFDAMVGTELALAVCFPIAGNLGGGGFMVYRDKNGATGCLDFRERAPLAAKKDMFLDSDGKVIPGKSTQSTLSIAVPGTVAGIFEVHRKFGSIPIERIFQKVILLAHEGYVLSEDQAKSLEQNREELIQKNGTQSLYSKPWKAGDRIKQPQLAKTLRILQNKGAKAFYKGEIGKKLVNYIRSKGGIITLKDLENYRAIWRNPHEFTFGEYQFITSPLPSSGGFCLQQVFGMLSKISKIPPHNSVEYIHLISELLKRSFLDRNRFLGDPDFTKIPLDKLLSDDYLSQKVADFKWERATASNHIYSLGMFESDETTHYSIYDPYGNAVSVTTTLNGAYGSKYFVDELGFFLNNEMDDFSAKEGSSNMFGQVGSVSNEISPGKRPLSSMTPTIVVKNSQPVLIVGSPGGTTIISTVLQVCLNVIHHGMDIQTAVDAPRFHHQHSPDEIRMEPEKFSSTTIKKLKKMGHTINETISKIIGKVSAIQILSEDVIAVGADKRGDNFGDGF